MNTYDITEKTTRNSFDQAAWNSEVVPLDADESVNQWFDNLNEEVTKRLKADDTFLYDLVSHVLDMKDTPFPVLLRLVSQVTGLGVGKVELKYNAGDPSDF